MRSLKRQQQQRQQPVRADWAGVLKGGKRAERAAGIEAADGARGRERSGYGRATSDGVVMCVRFWGWQGESLSWAGDESLKMDVSGAKASGGKGT